LAQLLIMNKKELEKLGEIGSLRIYVALLGYLEDGGSETFDEVWISKYLGELWIEVLIGQYQIKYMLVYTTFGDTGCNRPYGVVFNNGVVVAIINGFSEVRSNQNDVIFDIEEGPRASQ